MNAAARGGLWMVAAAASLTAMAACIRYLPAYSVLLLIFLRNVINLALLAPSLLRRRAGVFRTRRLGAHALRNAFLYGGNVAWFYGVTKISLADVAALQFTSPLFTALIAAMFLGERLDGHRVLAIAAGLVGAVAIIRPGVVPFNSGTVLVLAAALLYSCAHVATKRLADTESGTTVVFFMSVTVLVYSAGPALAVWRTPEPQDLPAIVGLGVTGYATHYCITRSLAEADAAFVIAFDFFRLPFSVLLGWLLFTEALDLWTGAGALVIFAAGYYSTVREAGRGRPG